VHRYQKIQKYSMKRRVAPILFACFIGITLCRAGYYIRHRALYQLPETNSPIAFFVQTLNSFKSTGTILTVHDDNGIMRPYRGNGLGEPLLSFVLNGLFSIESYSEMMTIFNFSYNAFVLLLFSLLLYFHSRSAGLMYLLAGAFITIPSVRPGPDHYAIFGGHFSLIMLVSVIMLSKKSLGGKRHWLVVKGLISLSMLSWLYLFRTIMGYFGIFTFILVCLRQIRLNSKRSVSFILLGFIFGSLLIPFLPHVIIAARDKFYGFNKSSAKGYSISHTLYSSLGNQPNPWGIVYGDNYAVNKAKTERPDIEIYSTDYYDWMWGAYFRALRSHPIAAFKIYVKKLMGILWNPVEVMVLSLVLFALSRNALRLKHDFNHLLVLAWIAFIVTFLTLSQGFVAIPDRVYVGPADLGYVLLWALLAELVKACQWKWSYRFSWGMTIIRVAFALVPDKVGSILFIYVSMALDVLHFFIPFGVLAAVITESSRHLVERDNQCGEL